MPWAVDIGGELLCARRERERATHVKRVADDAEVRASDAFGARRAPSGETLETACQLLTHAGSEAAMEGRREALAAIWRGHALSAASERAEKM